MASRYDSDGEGAAQALAEISRTAAGADVVLNIKSAAIVAAGFDAACSALVKAQSYGLKRQMGQRARTAIIRMNAAASALDGIARQSEDIGRSGLPLIISGDQANAVTSGLLSARELLEVIAACKLPYALAQEVRGAAEAVTTAWAHMDAANRQRGAGPAATGAQEGSASEAQIAAGPAMRSLNG